MKTIDRIALALFSSLILIFSVILCLAIFGWIDTDLLGNLLEIVITDRITSKILLGLAIIFILLAIKCIFFDSTSKEQVDYKNGILLENSNGKLLITKETIENLVNAVVKGFDSAEEVATKIDLDKDNNLTVNVNLVVKENAVIKELTSNLQAKIKEAESHLIRLQELISSNENLSNPEFMMIITGTDMAYTLPSGVLVVPIGCLKD